ncbi:MAG: TetR/AcrR family transcriptional regulator [Candidatus Binataceae bacterium]
MSNLQEERSAETRQRLMDATVECLFERGYAGTTTTEIASRAGVSRGAQLHHFPKKDELVISALEHVFALRIAQMRDMAAERPTGGRAGQMASLVDALWPFFKGPTFYAWLELVVASRTEPALNEAVRDASKRFGDGLLEGFGAMLDWPADRGADLSEIIWMIFGQLESLGLERVLFPADEPDPPEFARALATIKKLSAILITDMGLNGPEKETIR